MHHFASSKLFLLPAVFLFLGLGCSSQPVVVPAPIITAPTTTTEAPLLPDQTQEAVSFCERNGNKSIVQLDDQTKKMHAVCLFADNTACDAIAYMENTCRSGNGARVVGGSDSEITALIRNCNDADPAVCGNDGNNYTNHCVAELPKVAILHTGSCTANEQANPLTETPSQTSTTTLPTAASATGGTEIGITEPKPAGGEQIASWLPTIEQIIQSTGPQSPRSIISSCVLNTSQFYLYQESSEKSFAVLYNIDGRIQCFPNNDITHSCPAGVEIGQRATNCRQIWKDSR